MSKLKSKKTIFVAVTVLAVLISTFVLGSNKSTPDEKDIEKATKAAMQVIPFFSEEYAKRSDDIKFAVSQEEAVEIARGAMISTLKDRGIDPAELGIEKLVPSATEKRVHYKTQKTCWRIEFTFEDKYYGANMFDIFVDTQNGDVVENANSFT